MQGPASACQLSPGNVMTRSRERQAVVAYSVQDFLQRPIVPCRTVRADARLSHLRTGAPTALRTLRLKSHTATMQAVTSLSTVRPGIARPCRPRTCRVQALSKQTQAQRTGEVSKPQLLSQIAQSAGLLAAAFLLTVRSPLCDLQLGTLNLSMKMSGSSGLLHVRPCFLS